MATHPILTRRTLLQGLGTALALPMLEAMNPGTARASYAPTKAPVRMAFLYVANGKHMPDWRPANEGALEELPATLKPLEAHKKDMLVFSGLTLNGGRALGDGPGDHARSVASFLTGAHPKKTAGADITNGISVDQIAAGKIGSQTRFASLELGTEPSQKSGNCDSGYSCIYFSNLSWRTETSPMAKETDPRLVFDRLFGNKDESQEGKAKYLREQRKQSVLDFVRDDAEGLRRKLGHTDQRKLDEYLYAIRDIEKRLHGSDQPAAAKAGSFPRPERKPSEFGDQVKLMMDLMALAFQTDSTRVITFMYTNDSSNRSYPHLEVKEGHHDLSHHGGNKEKQEKIARINKYHVTLLNHFVDRMASIRDGESSLLDSSMVLYGSGIGDGDRHNHDDLPIIMLGKGGGTIQGGRYVRYKRDTPMTNLYLSMLDRIGAKTDKMADSTGLLTGLEG